MFDILTIDQLEGITGGNIDELSEDSQFLYKAGLCNRYSYFSLLENPEQSQNILDAWRKVGIECKPTSICENEYYTNGKRITRSEAIEILKNK